MAPRIFENIRNAARRGLDRLRQANRGDTGPPEPAFAGGAALRSAADPPPPYSPPAADANRGAQHSSAAPPPSSRRESWQSAVSDSDTLPAYGSGSGERDVAAKAAHTMNGNVPTPGTAIAEEKKGISRPSREEVNEAEREAHDALVLDGARKRGLQTRSRSRGR